ncbi:MAG: DUF3795 domain-containing protein [Dehalococcoidales bacterium]|nr:DUF3795 domain-containing protein [Dehalococcoidales bacterium]
MFDKEKLQLVSPCGYCCLSCAGYEHSVCDDDVVIQKEAKRANLSVDELRGSCAGCRPKQGRPIMNMLCQTYDCCVNKKGLDFCYQCEDFPCLKLAPISGMAEVRRHNTKIYNLLMLKKLGLDEYIERSGELLRQWARGETPVLGDDVQIPKTS